jgi:Trk-type K+ transport system membrane component
MKFENDDKKMVIKAGNRAVDYYTVDQIFWGLVATLIIWCLIALMTGSLFQ